MDWLTIAANVSQLLGVAWAIFFGGKALKEVIQGLQKRQPLHVSSSFVSNLLSAGILLMLVLIFIWLVGNPLLGIPSRLASSPSTSSSQASSNSGGNHTSTDRSTPATSPTPAQPVQVEEETLPENITLKCDGCSDPVVLTITSIRVEPQKNRMVWSITLYNNSQSSAYCYFDQFYLQNSLNEDQIYDSTGDIRDINTCMTLDPLQANETRNSTVTFSFVPYKAVPYTLMAKLITPESQDIIFNPVNIKF
ncbi:MAG TPA: hypothetical protein VKV37_14935 [Ktedonobacteraceae bacterium]|jgi:hypothetical protein|nr:hypothetical protein [Ktedonobacteraceae bacterium]